MKTLFTAIPLLILGVWALLVGYNLDAVSKELSETRATLALCRAQNTDTLRPYCIAKVIYKDTVPGFYKFLAYGEEDGVENAFYLYTKINYPAKWVITYPTDSIVDKK